MAASQFAADVQQRSSATAARTITGREIDGDLRFLSHDLLGDRALAWFRMLVTNARAAPMWNREAFARAGKVP